MATIVELSASYLTQLTEHGLPVPNKISWDTIIEAIPICTAIAIPLVLGFTAWRFKRDVDQLLAKSKEPPTPVIAQSRPVKKPFIHVLPPTPGYIVKHWSRKAAPLARDIHIEDGLLERIKIDQAALRHAAKEIDEQVK